MKRLFDQLSLWLVIGMTISLPVTLADDFGGLLDDNPNDRADQTPPMAFVYEPGERLRYDKCLANFNRGKKCHALLDRLCNRIQNKNTECRLLRVEQCHQENRQHQTKAEKSCEHGAHQQPCYGIAQKCRQQEFLACKKTNYQERYCSYYKWQYCRKEVGMVDGQFKSKACRVFHNNEMIKFYEGQISKALRWEPRGDNNITQTLALMTQQRNQMSQQIEAIKKQRESLQDLLQQVIASFIPKIKKQQQNLQKQQQQLGEKIRQITIKINEYSYMGKLCQELGPYR